MNKKTKALTTEQYKEIIQTMREGFSGCRPNKRTATALVLEGNLGLRISDILQLRLRDIVRDGDRYRLEITEQKTGKRRQVGLPDWLITEIIRRAGASEWAFPGRDSKKHRTRQAVWKDIKRVQRALRLDINLGTHSMRKDYAVWLMRQYGDIAKVQRALNHDSSTVTMLYAMADKLTETAQQRRNVRRRKR